ncbi:MAG: hypothetical protein PHU97_04125 [Bacteroidales bacterium]|nr:hypothetical protein [Bacteroidales bacterium]MDD3010484.1 hypothetical protein [Bacteroidales bacterium]MDD3961972.1 hypothetical protein [Bacteroidales bacterium]MDY0286972.1 hypothetical protein [Bacteroidales bacterium]HPE87791.1 hypothetical protein [Bacteroidales bacterium]
MPKAKDGYNAQKMAFRLDHGVNGNGIIMPVTHAEPKGVNPSCDTEGTIIYPGKSSRRGFAKKLAEGIVPQVRTLERYGFVNH